MTDHRCHGSCVQSFFRNPNNCDVADKRGEKRGIDVVEGEGQASSTDNIYQPAAANVTEGAER